MIECLVFCELCAKPVEFCLQAPYLSQDCREVLGWQEHGSAGRREWLAGYPVELDGRMVWLSRRVLLDVDGLEERNAARPVSNVK